MKILHYTIGFAPERTGGLVGYATDLMIEQKRQCLHYILQVSYFLEKSQE